MPETIQGLLFDLPDPLSGNIEAFAYLFQSVFGVLADPKTQSDNFFLSGAQGGQNAGDAIR